MKSDVIRIQGSEHQECPLYVEFCRSRAPTRRAGIRPTATYSGATGNDLFTSTPAVVLTDVLSVLLIVVTSPTSFLPCSRHDKRNAHLPWSPL
jgi:hypothetical protein